MIHCTVKLHGLKLRVCIHCWFDLRRGCKTLRVEYGPALTCQHCGEVSP